VGGPPHLELERVIPMTEQRNDSDAPSGVETGSAPQPLDFPGADQEPPGRPDGDQDPDQDPDAPAADAPAD
jgi:hypothetical protein